jgi:hypothetical protein
MLPLLSKVVRFTYSGVKYAPVNYAVWFSGPVTALRAGTRAKSKSSHGSVTPTPNKLLPTGDISHSLAGVELSSTSSIPDTTVSN